MIPNMNNFNNISETNPMNGSQETLYMNNFQLIWNCMQLTPNVIEEDLNQMNNILSLINLPVILPYHKKHPLINCKTPQRIMKSPNWSCNWCKQSYSYNVPSFYCTNCDYDLCQRCFLKLNAFQIIIYNYRMGLIEEKEIPNTSFFNSAIHYHPMVPILREASYYTSDLKCNLCINNIQKEQEFYYCSLCNYCICLYCYINKISMQKNSSSGNQINTQVSPSGFS